MRVGRVSELVTPHTVQVGITERTWAFYTFGPVEFAPLSKAARMHGVPTGEFVTRILNVLCSLFFYSTNGTLPFLFILLWANILQTGKAFVVFVGHATRHDLLGGDQFFAQ